MDYKQTNINLMECGGGFDKDGVFTSYRLNFYVYDNDQNPVNPKEVLRLVQKYVKEHYESEE